MKLDVICRICLLEKANMKPLFEACVPNMLMSCASIQVLVNDGLPNRICMQCLQNVNKSYTFKQLCEKSDATLRQYMQMQTTDSLINSMKTDHLFDGNEDLQQSSLFQEIFNDTTHSLVEDFTNQTGGTVVPDLAETVQSLQIIAEQCLPESWDSQCNGTMSDAQSGFPETFKDDWTLNDHIKNHATELDKHLLEQSLNKAFDDDTSSKLFEKTYMCNICDRVFIDDKMLKKHLEEIHYIVDAVPLEGEKKYSCNVCGKKYKHNKNLLVHIRTSHGGERPHKCDLCNRSYSLASSLTKHRLLHTGEKKFSCNVCGKKFSQSSNLNSHLKIHSGLKNHVCSVCNKDFSTASSLDVHMRSHTGIKPYLCACCESCFASATELKKHSMKHTGEKPYGCWQCGKSFARKETRDTHMRYHTGERPYSCSLCPKKYIAASHLRTHMKSHNNERKYQCMICLKAFIEAKTLRKHELTHMPKATDQQHLNCQLCGNNYNDSWGLMEHLKNCSVGT